MGGQEAMENSRDAVAPIPFEELAFPDFEEGLLGPNDIQFHVDMHAGPEAWKHVPLPEWRQLVADHTVLALSSRTGGVVPLVMLPPQDVDLRRIAGVKIPTGKTYHDEPVGAARVDLQEYDHKVIERAKPYIAARPMLEMRTAALEQALKLAEVNPQMVSEATAMKWLTELGYLQTVLGVNRLMVKATLDLPNAEETVTPLTDTPIDAFIDKASKIAKPLMLAASLQGAATDTLQGLVEPQSPSRIEFQMDGGPSGPSGPQNPSKWSENIPSDSGHPVRQTVVRVLGVLTTLWTAGCSLFNVDGSPADPDEYTVLTSVPPTAVSTSTSEATKSPATATVEPPPTEGVPNAPTPGPKDKWPDIQQLPVSVSPVTNPIDATGDKPINPAKEQLGFMESILREKYAPNGVKYNIVHSMEELKNPNDVFIRYRDSGDNLPQGWVLSVETIDGGLWAVLNDSKLAPRPDWATSDVAGFRLVKPDKPLPAGATSAMEQVGNFWTRVYRTADGQLLASMTWETGVVKWQYTELAEATVAVPTEVSPPVEQLPDSCFKIVDQAVGDFPNLDPQHRTVDKAFQDAQFGGHYGNHVGYDPKDPYSLLMKGIIVGTGKISVDYKGKQVTALCIVIQGPKGEYYPSPLGIEVDGQWISFVDSSQLGVAQTGTMETVEKQGIIPLIGTKIEARFVKYWSNDAQFGQGRDVFTGIVNENVPNGDKAAILFQKSYAAYATHYATVENPKQHVYGPNIIPLMTQPDSPKGAYTNQIGAWLVWLAKNNTIKAGYID